MGDFNSKECPKKCPTEEEFNEEKEAFYEVKREYIELMNNNNELIIKDETQSMREPKKGALLLE